ncbi:ankyrin-2-like isoform X1 [Lytechinus pictus]|uniref:ankyrin-2-like isoform X1 n=2 Tax=Lytechinus pictus TaxID=7653 RepID=UPI0030B9EB0D
MTSPEIGQRVVRSSEWSWRYQDGGEGHLGTVVKMTDQETPLHGWTRVRWDNGLCNKYRVGTGRTYDLLLFDSAPAGAVHSKITCSSCNVDSIHGIRWKCCDHSCTDVNLCTPCYMADKHDLTHRFIRFNSQDETGIVVTSRSEEEKIVSMGLCPEAQVSRGEDWQGEENDGQGGNVIESCAISGRPRSGVSVKWIDTGQTTTHRVGHDGNVDLKCTKPGRGIGFYSSHLPILGKEQGVKVGDRVAMTLAAERLQVIQETNGCKWSPRMQNLITKVAMVTSINSDGNVEISYPGRDDHFILHPDALNKVPMFEKGDRVGVKTDKEYVKGLQKNSNNGWADGMENCLDKEGTVLLVNENFNTWIRFESVTPSDSWWHPCALTLVEKKPHHVGYGAKSTHIKSEITGLSKDDNSIESQLYNAAKTGDLDRVSEILSSSPEKVNGKVNGKSALHKASIRGHLKVVRALVEAGADIEITTDDGHTPLHYAVEGDEPAVVNYLIEKGADIDRGSKRHRRAIHRAAYENFVDCARILIRRGCDVNVQDSEKDTPLHDAIIKNSIDVAEMLLVVPKLDTTLTNKRNMPPILFAALKDRPELVEMLGRHSPQSIPVTTRHGFNILHIAACNNHVQVMRMVLAIKDHGLYLDTKADHGTTALHLAAEDGYSESVEYLLSQGADVNLQCRKGHSALHRLASAARQDLKVEETQELKAIRMKYKDGGVDTNTEALLCFMVLHGASIDIENESCRTPLYYIDDPKLKRTLKQIANGVNRNPDQKPMQNLGEGGDFGIGRLNMKSISDDNLLIPDSGVGFAQELATDKHDEDHPTRSQSKDLKELGNFCVDDKTDLGIDFDLLKAAEIGDLRRVSEILSSSPEKVNVKLGGKNALHKASLHGHRDVVKALLEAGADIEITTDDGHTPLHLAVEGDEPAVTKYLLEEGADMNKVNVRNMSPLHRAASRNHVDCARILINHGCNVNMQDYQKDTPLHDAITKNSVDVAELLLKVPSIDTSIENGNKFTPLQFAVIKGRLEIVKMVARHCPSSIAVPKQHGYNVLHIAAVNNHVEVMKFLLAIEDHGLCIETKNSEGQTALHLASHKAYSESIEYLISLRADINSQCSHGHSPLHLVASRAARKPTEIKETSFLKRIRKKYRDRGVGSNTGAALLCFMVLHGASIDTENESCRTPLYYIKDPKLKRTLKEIARGDRAVDLKSLEDMVGDEASEDLTTNAIHDDDYDISVPHTPVDDPASSDQGSENLARTNKPKIGLFELVHEIKVSDLKMGSVVGTGQYGVVHRATWRGTTVAVKKISIIGSKKDEVEKEVSIHRQATHPNIVKMMALGYECTDAYLVMEFIEGPSLDKIIFPDRDDPKIHLDWSAKLGISREVLQAVTFMHASNILHLDIKPANILVERATNRPFICDMGLAHIKNRNAMTQSTMHIRGTPQFMPPEVITAVTGYKHSSKHDIWSVAGTLVEFYSMKRLWGVLPSPMALILRVMAGKMGKPEALEFVDPKIQEILEPCFNENPEDRPSAEELQNKFNDLS